jgi:hypothetical protein
LPVSKGQPPPVDFREVMKVHILRLGAITVLLAMMMGMLALTRAMILYPGGTELDPHGLGHSFWFNCLCDLTSDRALNGISNGPAAALARLGMASLAVAVGAFWLILPALLTGNRPAAPVIRIAGTISVLGLFAVPIAADSWHPVAVFASVIPALIAGAMGLACMVRGGRDRWMLGAACATFAASLVDAVLYAERVSTHLSSNLAAVPVFQRLAMLAMLVWMGTAALRILVPGSSRRVHLAAAPAAGTTTLIVANVASRARGDGDHDQAPGPQRQDEEQELQRHRQRVDDRHHGNPEEPVW